jgi:23S rRNA pseudouridine1911/1915/1917 synthase
LPHFGIWVLGFGIFKMLGDPEILCEDGPVIAVNKPPGMVSQAGPPDVPSIVNQVMDYLKRKYDKPGAVYLGVPHRLDRPVSGVLVFSRNSKCAARLAEQFAKRQVKKVYRAVVETPPEPASGELVDWLYRIPNEPRTVISTPDTPDAKEARLSYRTIAKAKGRALVEVDLGTGRMHQIRIQLSSRGWPIVGDFQYGAKSEFPTSRSSDSRENQIALHAYQLTILHPIRYESLTITAPLPRSWAPFGFGTAGENPES